MAQKKIHKQATQQGGRHEDTGQSGAGIDRKLHDPVADREVVPDEIQLRLGARGEEDLVRVRDLHDPLSDLDLDERRRHLEGRYRVLGSDPLYRVDKRRTGTCARF